MNEYLFIGGKNTPNGRSHGESGVDEIARKCRKLLTLRRVGRLGTEIFGLAAIIAEEIVMQNERDAQQHIGIDAPTLENIVNVGTFAIEFAGEPAHRPLLPPQFRLDQFTDMYHAAVP